MLRRRAPACGGPQSHEWLARSWSSGGGSRTQAPVRQRADMHGSSEAVTLAAGTPAQITPPPRGHRGSRREGQQVDRPAPASPPNPAPSRRGAESLRKIPGPHSRPPGPIPPSLCGPDGEHTPLAEITSAGGEFTLFYRRARASPTWSNPGSTRLGRQGASRRAKVRLSSVW